MLADLDLPPQRDIGRHVQRALPYDGHRVDLHPMSPLGLSRTGRAPFLLLLNRCSMIASTRALLTYPGLSFPSRTGLSVPACGRPAGHRIYRRSCSRPTGGRGGAPCPPHPLSQRLRSPDHQRKKIDRQTRALETAASFWQAATPGRSRARRRTTSPRALCRTTRVYVTHQLRRRPQRASPKSPLPASPRHAANTQHGGGGGRYS